MIKDAIVNLSRDGLRTRVLAGCSATSTSENDGVISLAQFVEKCAQGLLKQTSFIIHWRSWQAAGGFAAFARFANFAPADYSRMADRPGVNPSRQVQEY
jgi:hypothetical protein